MLKIIKSNEHLILNDGVSSYKYDIKESEKGNRLYVSIVKDLCDRNSKIVDFDVTNDNSFDDLNKYFKRMSLTLSSDLEISKKNFFALSYNQMVSKLVDRSTAPKPKDVIKFSKIPRYVLEYTIKDCINKDGDVYKIIIWSYNNTYANFEIIEYDTSKKYTKLSYHDYNYGFIFTYNKILDCNSGKYKECKLFLTYIDDNVQYNIDLFNDDIQTKFQELTNHFRKNDINIVSKRYICKSDLTNIEHEALKNVYFKEHSYNIDDFYNLYYDYTIIKTKDKNGKIGKIILWTESKYHGDSYHFVSEPVLDFYYKNPETKELDIISTIKFNVLYKYVLYRKGSC